MTRGRWIFDRQTGQLIPAAEFYARKYEGVQTSDLPAPMIVKDTEPYRSVIDGSLIGGRRQHREHLKAHGCVEVGNEMKSIKGPVAPPKHEVVADIKRAIEQGPPPELSQALAKAKHAVQG